MLLKQNRKIQGKNVCHALKLIITYKGKYREHNRIKRNVCQLWGNSKILKIIKWKGNIKLKKESVYFQPYEDILQK